MKTFLLHLLILFLKEKVEETSQRISSKQLLKIMLNEF